MVSVQLHFVFLCLTLCVTLEPWFADLRMAVHEERGANTGFRSLLSLIF